MARALYWLSLFSPTLLALWRSGGEGGREWQSLLWAAAACAIPATLPRRSFAIAQWLTIISLPILLWWIGYAALNGTGPGWEAAVAAVSTNPDEAHEAFRLVATTPGFLAFGSACAIFLLASVVTLKMAARGSGQAAASALPRQTILAAALMLFAVSTLTAATGLSAPILFQPADASFSPLGTATRFVMAGLDRAMFGNLLEGVSERRPAHAPRQATGASLAIFVLGESVRAGGIGKEKAGRGPWTKALDERMTAGLGTWLPTTCASSHGSNRSVPMVLTGTPPEDFAEAATAPSVLAVLKDAGFVTAWISNQDPSVFKENGHDYYWTVGITDSFHGAYDEGMLPLAAAFAAPLARRDSSTLKPRAMVLHMHGSHFEYVERYPPYFFPPEPEGISPEGLTDLRYERSEEYSAKVLVDLASLLDRTSVPAFLVFSSDHGENLPSDHNGLRVHIGPRVSIRDGTTTTFVLWNKAMAETGRPAQVLASLRTVPMIAHVDVARAFLALAGMTDGPVSPVLKPQILAPIVIAGPIGPNACSQLKP